MWVIWEYTHTHTMKVYIYAYLHTHTHIYAGIYVHVCMYVCIQVLMLRITPSFSVRTASIHKYWVLSLSSSLLSNGIANKQNSIIKFGSKSSILLYYY